MITRSWSRNGIVIHIDTEYVWGTVTIPHPRWLARLLDKLPSVDEVYAYARD